MMRNTRSSTIRCAAEYWYRIEDYYEGTPLDFLGVPEMSDDEERTFWAAFFAKNKCCKQPFFCRRVHERWESTWQDHDDPDRLVGSGGFILMVNVWAGNGGGESGTTIRNEHQNARFAAAVRIRRRGNGGAGGKAVRVVTQSFVKTVADDHRTLYKLPRRRRLKRNIKALSVTYLFLFLLEILIRPIIRPPN